ncbi:MAG: MFS transporter [Pirellulales bacterium]|nr:MFS transporter [Pirellulales bacterium]
MNDRPPAAIAPPALDLAARRRARRLAYWNALLWSIGNGLSGSTLVIYLAMELRAERIGLSIGLILAARHFIGVLRLGTPAMLDRRRDRKRFCTITFALSGVLLLCLPICAAPKVLPSANASVWALVMLWCSHHLMQYLGTIALYSWLADLVPTAVRGRFFGRRERWLVAGEAAAAIACGWFAWEWCLHYPKSQHWIGYAIPAGFGALFILAAIVPLRRMPRAERSADNANCNDPHPVPAKGRPGETTRNAYSWNRLWKPLGDRAFLAFLLFGCWFSAANGITQTVQNSYPKQVLQVGLFLMLAVQTGMRLGQIGVSPYLGRAADRFGNKPMMLFCLLITAQGPLFYLFSTPESWCWFVGAWIAWIAYAGLNIGLPNLMLKIAPRDQNADYLAIYYTCAGLCYGGTTLLGGWLFDRYKSFTWSLGGTTWDVNQTTFLLGWIVRLTCLFFLCGLIEPKSPQFQRIYGKQGNIGKQ